MKIDPGTLFKANKHSLVFRMDVNDGGFYVPPGTILTYLKPVPNSTLYHILLCDNKMIEVPLSGHLSMGSLIAIEFEE